MRDGRPSLTAAIVAFGRGIGLWDDRRDEMARELAPAPFSVALSALDRTRIARRPARLFARAATLGLVDHAALRMAAVDEAVRRAAADGVEQLVLLGAGLDTRAWRMPELGAVRVFEVDHPATQAYKRERVGARSATARDVRFVPVDFERDSLGSALSAAGHDPAVPTAWLWEAVTMYLQHAAIDATLEALSARSAGASHLLVTYAKPEVFEVSTVASNLAQVAFDVFGEPLVGRIEPEDMARRVESVGFSVASDTDSRDWASRNGVTHLLSAAFRTERLIEAVRR